MSARKHLFISHHFADDQSVESLTSMLKKSGWDVRNSSIRLKEANKQRLERGEVSDRTLKRVLGMKISWAQATIVLIGKDTHKRSWVNFEIEQSHKLGKPIIGVYERGNQNAALPDALERYATSIVAWNTESIIKAVESGCEGFENPDGSQRNPQSESRRGEC